MATHSIEKQVDGNGSTHSVEKQVDGNGSTHTPAFLLHLWCPLPYAPQQTICIKTHELINNILHYTADTYTHKGAEHVSAVVDMI